MGLLDYFRWLGSFDCVHRPCWNKRYPVNKTICVYHKNMRNCSSFYWTYSGLYCHVSIKPTILSIIKQLLQHWVVKKHINVICQVLSAVISGLLTTFHNVFAHKFSGFCHIFTVVEIEQMIYISYKLIKQYRSFCYQIWFWSG